MILVTGATGLVGSHLLVQLLQENEAVKALYRTEKQIEKVRKVFIFKNQEVLFKKIEWIKGDINDIPSLEIAIKMIRQAVDIYNSKRRHYSLQFKTPNFAHVNQQHDYVSYKRGIDQRVKC